jgi:hypothetical protein
LDLERTCHFAFRRTRNEGMIAPGDRDVGSLGIAGNYSQAGFLDINLAGLGSASVLNTGGRVFRRDSERFAAQWFGSGAGRDISRDDLRVGEREFLQHRGSGTAR